MPDFRYDRTPPCSLLDPTQCSQFFHDVRIEKLKPGTTYYYRIPGGNGTDPSQILDFTTARAAGDSTPFTVAVLADMGYTNAKNTHKHLVSAVQDGAAFVWHGGDISYADQWYAGILPCVLTGPKAWPLCYNGSETTTPLGKIGELPNDTTVNPEYYLPLPAGEQPIQGGPAGGDISTVYEINWDLWQQWMNQITKFSPYMVAPGNHEATCAEFDGPNNEVTAILENNEPPHIGMSAPKSTLNYYSCPPSQRNFTAYQHRFTMPGDVSGGVGNFWYSFDYGLAHFITFDGETDFPLSPEWTFEEELAKKNISGSHPTNRTQTYVTDSGPFGRVSGDFKVKESYEQYHWLKKDLESVDRKKTPWVIAMSHRPMYATEGGGYQSAMRSAFEDLFLEYGVDLYLSGHIHYYERMLPLGKNYTLIHDAVKDEHTYVAKKGSVAHIVNGQAGQLEGPSVLKPGQAHANYSAFLDEKNWGFGKINVYNASVLGFEFVRATDGSLGDYLWLVKE